MKNTTTATTTTTTKTTTTRQRPRRRRRRRRTTTTTTTTTTIVQLPTTTAKRSKTAIVQLPTTTAKRSKIRPPRSLRGRVMIHASRLVAGTRRACGVALALATRAGPWSTDVVVAVVVVVVMAATVIVVVVVVVVVVATMAVARTTSCMGPHRGRYAAVRRALRPQDIPWHGAPPRKSCPRTSRPRWCPASTYRGGCAHVW